MRLFLSVQVGALQVIFVSINQNRLFLSGLRVYMREGVKLMAQLLPPL